MGAPETTDTAVAVREAAPVVVSAAEGAFALAQRQAQALAKSTLIPKEYQGNIANVMVAMELAERTNSSPLMVMQSLDIIHGRPSWRSVFVIASINRSGRFSPLQYRIAGEGMKRECVAYATDLKSGEVIEGPPVSMQTAKDEGWLSKNGSKWKTMPDLMLRYRAATFFGRTEVPELLLGMPDAQETYDITPTAGYVREEVPAADALARLQGAMNEEAPEVVVPQSDHPEAETIECELCGGSGRDPEIPGDICGACGGQGRTLV